MWQKCAAAFKCQPLEGVLSHEMRRFSVDSEKVIISKIDLNKEIEVEEFEFETNQVFPTLVKTLIIEFCFVKTERLQPLCSIPYVLKCLKPLCSILYVLKCLLSLCSILCVEMFTTIVFNSLRPEMFGTTLCSILYALKCLQLLCSILYVLKCLQSFCSILYVLKCLPTVVFDSLRAKMFGTIVPIRVLLRKFSNIKVFLMMPSGPSLCWTSALSGFLRRYLYPRPCIIEQKACIHSTCKATWRSPCYATPSHIRIFF